MILIKKQLINVSIIVFVTFLISSCTSSKRINANFNYFQTGLDSTRRIDIKPLLITFNDQLSIQVSSNSMNQEQVAIFNITNNGIASTSTSSFGNSATAAVSSNMNQGSNSSTMGYLVDHNGYIKFPMLGLIRAEGKTRVELADEIAKLLVDKDFVKDPVVQVRFLSLKVNVLGEVKSPGIKSFSSDRITILDALGAAGDLSEYGRRDNIKIIREERGIQKVININLVDANFMEGKGYQLQQNDVIYVYANENRIKEIGFDPKTTHDLQVYSAIVGLISITATLYLLFKK